MTQETDTSLNKWKNWLGTNSVGIYPYGNSGMQAQWYKPHQNCKMQYLNRQYCDVCVQTIIEKIHRLTNPIASYHPIVKYIYMTEYNDFKINLITPIPNTLNIKWTLDEALLNYNNMDSIRITDEQVGDDGIHVLSACVIDTTAMLRVDNHSEIHLNKIDWTINKNVGIISSEIHNITYSIFPNPTNEIINYAVESENNLPLIIQICNVNGEIIEQINTQIERRFIGNFNIKSQANGVYFINFRMGDITHTLKFIKE
jgi:hypothetical protein